MNGHFQFSKGKPLDSIAEADMMFNQRQNPSSSKKEDWKEEEAETY